MNNAFSLHHAIASQDNQNLEALIKKGIDLEQTDANGSSALMVAIENHNHEAAKRLIEQGAKVNTQNARGESALVKAIKEKQIGIAKLLVEHGADCTEGLARGGDETVVNLAAWYRDYELFELMVKKIKREQPEVLEEVDREGRSLLHRAVVEYQPEVTEILLRQGVDINAGGRRNNRALHYAAEYGRVEQIKLLLTYGADRKARNFDSRTALDIARLLKQEACIELLEAEPLEQNKASDSIKETGFKTKSCLQSPKCLQSPDKTHPVYLNDKSWEEIKGYVELGTMGRPRKASAREIIEGILYKQATGCEWRGLPKNYPKWETVCSCYYRWKSKGIWDKVEAAVKNKAAV